jgi:hypothetical protein
MLVISDSTTSQSLPRLLKVAGSGGRSVDGDQHPHSFDKCGTCGDQGQDGGQFQAKVDATGEHEMWIEISLARPRLAQDRHQNGTLVITHSGLEQRHRPGLRAVYNPATPIATTGRHT